ncbi:hypothetical protein ATJ97_2444 [Georgenia soli]|uniref:Uncharacterized protein n=1 Tax=Georgenia soli TaxID=638953 RepID=A0A2A9ELT0_9MICO|nr:hypothetical protein [Georgenia soli]PFG39924.1 hypothetical protein ATJ97_2444 [Georgenia soli]
MLSVPPKMSAAQMFWLGAGLTAFQFVSEWLLYGSAVALNFPSVVLLAVGVAGQLGIGLIVASIIVKALIAPRATLADTESPHRGIP